MPLKFNGAWRFEPPTDGKFRNSSIPDSAVEECIDMIMKVAGQGERQEILEHFKKRFCQAIGTTHVRSTSTSWAETDLRTYMEEASSNAPLFIEAFYDTCKFINDKGEEFFAPDADMINDLLAKYSIGFEVRPPNLAPRETTTPLVVVKESPLTTLAEKAVEIFQESLRRSEELLLSKRGREAVQESLWLLETVSTAFRGLETGTDTVAGKYFNQIVKELRDSNRGTTLECILKWLSSLHGFLSSPTGGGVRHGLDLNAGVIISENEARLFCNLIRSYISFLLVEHERLAKK